MGNSAGAQCSGLSNDPPARKGIYHRARRRKEGRTLSEKETRYIFLFSFFRIYVSPGPHVSQLRPTRIDFLEPLAIPPRRKVHFRPERGQNTTIIISSYWRTLAAVDVVDVGRKQAREGQIAARPLMLECPFTVMSRHKRGVVERRLFALPKNA